jgi:DNA-binding CsgD family transcriptional regulator
MPQIANLIDRIYEAAADPELWPRVLEDVGVAADAAGGVILARRSDAWLGWRCSAALEPGLDDWLHGSGPGRSQATTRLLGFDGARFGFADSMEAFSEEEWLADPLMAEWGAPAGLNHAAATRIDTPSGDMVIVQMNRRMGQPRFGPDDIARLDAFRPHLARAAMLAARWRLARLRAAAEALALLGLPAAIVDLGGRVLAANALIESSPHVRWLPGDRLALGDAAANALLKRAVAELRDPAAAAVRSFPARGAADDKLIVHLVPATGRARDLFDGGFGVAIVAPIVAPCAPDAELIRALFDLTVAEARVASGIAEGSTIEQIAEQRGGSVETVRAQLKSVFAKTGVRRQAQLASLLASPSLRQGFIFPST